MSGLRFTLLACTLTASAGCGGGPQFDPLEVVPPLVHALAHPLGDQVIAVVDLVDQRPPEERGDLALNDGFASSIWNKPYFAVMSEDPSALSHDVAPTGAHRARWTGRRSFSWYPFPFAGPVQPSSTEPAEALADYLALLLEQRSLTHRVIRVDTVGDAASAGADYVLTGSILHFAGVFAELLEPTNEPADDPLDYKLGALVGMDLKMARADGSLVWEDSLRSYEERPHLFDHLAALRGRQVYDYLHLDQKRMPLFIYEDITTHTRRLLEQLSSEALAGIEKSLGIKPPSID